MFIEDWYLQGYRQRGAYIATQAPMENTVNDFWRMIWDYQSRSIVMLCKMKEDGKVKLMAVSLQQPLRTVYMFRSHATPSFLITKVTVRCMGRLQ